MVVGDELQLIAAEVRDVMGPGWTMAADGWLWLLIWVAALVVMVWLVTRAPNGTTAPEEPLEILRRRFALGEISEIEYQRALQALELDRGETPK